MDSNSVSFINEFKQSFNHNTFKKLLLSKAIGGNDAIKRIQVRIVEIHQDRKFSFSYEYPTKNITKNFSLDESIEALKSLLQTQFKNAVLFTANNDMRLSFSKKNKSKIDYSKASFTTIVSIKHNEDKKKVIDIKDNLYLKELGVVTQNNQLAQNMQSKYKQINKYIETVDGILKASELLKKDKIDIVDMGSGKGYLTFSIYDFLTNQLKKETHVKGVEIREDLVNLCNEIAGKCDFKNLLFYKGDIKNFELRKTDLLIALHACDTATDDAIFKGIKAEAKVIITAPCCHKQIRRELNVENELKDIAKHGILKERMAEIVTDTMRGLMLEAYGYKTQIFEFIADAHTHKNVMIVGVKKKEKVDRKSFIQKIENLKTLFGIKVFYLESLFEETN